MVISMMQKASDKMNTYLSEILSKPEIEEKLIMGL